VVMPHPVFIGDTLRAETRVVDKRESKSRPTAGIVTFEHRMLNQRDEIVCQCRRTALIKKSAA
jgi:acyl dehydratase